jgi:hypothetical protein
MYVCKYIYPSQQKLFWIYVYIRIYMSGGSRILFNFPGREGKSSSSSFPFASRWLPVCLLLAANPAACARPRAALDKARYTILWPPDAVGNRLVACVERIA